jgi:hypothetical protein
LSTILDFFIEYNDSIIIFAIDKKLYSNYKIYNYDEKIEILDTSSILGKNNKYLSVITNTSDFQNTEFFLNRELNIYEDLHPMSVKENNYELKSKLMKLFILYQTDNWKSKASRVCFGVFDTRAKAIDSAKWQELYNHNSEVVVLEVTLNLFEEV